MYNQNGLFMSDMPIKHSRFWLPDKRHFKSLKVDLLYKKQIKLNNFVPKIIFVSLNYRYGTMNLTQNHFSDAMN